MRPALALSIALSLTACGGGGGGDSDGGAPPPPPPDDPSGQAVMPLDWEAGDAFGLVVLDRRRKTAEDLRAEECTLTVQVARAGVAGELARSDAEGACVVTDREPELSGLAPEPAAVCAGSLRVLFGSVDRNVSVCDPSRFGPPQPVDCADVAVATSLRVVSTAGELPEDEVGAFDVTVPVADTPRFVAPSPSGDGTALWPTGELTLEWGGMPGDSVEIAIGRQDGAGPKVRCFVPDTGRFTVPARLVEPYRGATGTVELARINQEQALVDGVAMRVSSRVATAAWLFEGVTP